MMMKRIALLFAALLSGLQWEVGSDLGMAFTCLIRPACLAVLAALLWPKSRRAAQLARTIGSVIIAETVALGVYARQTSPWYVLRDGETQLFMLIVTLEQIGLATALALIIGRIRGRNGQPTGARDGVPAAQDL